MSKLPLLTFRDFSKILNKIGFELVRQKGSHAFFQHSIDRGLLNKIIKHDLGMTREEFMKCV